MYEKIRIKNRRSLQSYIDEANKIHDFKYDYSMTDSNKFINGKSKLVIICMEHGDPYVFTQVISKHVHSGQGCPKCNESHAERDFSLILTNIGIEYEREKMFDGLIGTGGGNLRFDFYIDSLKIAVELDGEQHFKEVKFSNVKKLSHIKENDKKKNQFSKENGIRLIRIPFYKFKKLITEPEIRKMLAL
jgi:hypothetical protein